MFILVTLLMPRSTEIHMDREAKAQAHPSLETHEVALVYHFYREIPNQDADEKGGWVTIFRSISIPLKLLTILHAHAFSNRRSSLRFAPHQN